VSRDPELRVKTGFSTHAFSEVVEPRQRGPLGEQLTDAELEPIRVVYTRDGTWEVDYGSYARGHHPSREEAIGVAMTAAAWENRELTIERPRRISETAQPPLLGPGSDPGTDDPTL
jgi:hypothetical protein